jgi:glycosyltransferase involved in cell wall biosynthesis
MNDDSLIELSVVIPVYRSAATLRQLVDCLLPVLKAIAPRHEIVFVEDGSPDDSSRFNSCVILANTTP